MKPKVHDEVSCFLIPIIIEYRDSENLSNRSVDKVNVSVKAVYFHCYAHKQAYQD